MQNGATAHSPSPSSPEDNRNDGEGDSGGDDDDDDNDEALFWPTRNLVAIAGDNALRPSARAPTPTSSSSTAFGERGWVVGWVDRVPLPDPPVHLKRRRKRWRRDAIVSCVVPSSHFPPEDDAAAVIRAAEELSGRHPCARFGLETTMRRRRSPQRCGVCPSCIIYGRFEVVAAWDPRAPDDAAAKRVGCDANKGRERAMGEAPVPVIAPALQGPWWQDEGGTMGAVDPSLQYQRDANRDDLGGDGEDGTTSSSRGDELAKRRKRPPLRQIVLYEPCRPSPSLDHYRHCPYAEVGDRHDDYATATSVVAPGLRRSLLRISEATDVTEELWEILRAKEFWTAREENGSGEDGFLQKKGVQTKAASKDKANGSGAGRITKEAAAAETTTIRSSTKVCSDSCGEEAYRIFNPMQRWCSSLTVIHWRNRYREATAQPTAPFISRDAGAGTDANSEDDKVDSNLLNTLATTAMIISAQFPLLQCAILLAFRFRRQRNNGVKSGGGRFFVPRECRSRKVLAHDACTLRAVMDGILGVILGLAVVHHVGAVHVAVGYAWDALHLWLLRDNIGWLETFPVGFKLNVPLTQNMGRKILMVVDAHQEFLATWLLPRTSSLLYLLGAIGVAFGASTFFAVAFDFVRVVTVHVTVLFAVFCGLHRVQLSAFSSLWHLFRGKKRNVLRQRSDTLQYDSMQLLVGVILFTLCLFLFTTILVYYVFFVVVNQAVVVCAVFAWLLYALLERFPVGELVAFFGDSGRFPHRVVFSHRREEDVQNKVRALFPTGTKVSGGAVAHSSLSERNLIIVKLKRMTKSPGSILARAYAPLLSAFFSRALSFVSEILTGAPPSMLNVCLEVSMSVRTIPSN